MIFCDVGLNLLDDMFKGIYNGKQHHREDIVTVLDRAKSFGVSRNIVTAGCLREAQEALELSAKLNDFDIYTTVGIHPTRCGEFGDDFDAVANSLVTILSNGIASGKIVAIGECGLDYDRLHFCGKDQQMKGFLVQLDLAERFGLPMFLHNRNTSGDFLRVVTENRSKIRGGGVIHSFDSTLEEMNSLVDLGFYIGINGCSLKTDENLVVASQIPIDKLLIETDAPWCGVKNTHAGMKYVKTDFPTRKKEKYDPNFLVKDRNEPCKIIQILEILAALKGCDETELAHQIYRNTCELFFNGRQY